MKQYPWKFRLVKNGIEWGQSEKTLGSDEYFYYFYIEFVSAKQRVALKELEMKQFGLNYIWYDGPHKSLYLYFVSFSWSTQWTKSK